MVKRKRSLKELDKSLSSRREEASRTSRAEAEIVRNAQTKTNFNITAEGTFDIGISEGKHTTGFSTDASKTSNEIKKSFREAVFKSSEEYKQERSIEVTTEESFEEEVTESGEIMNKNDEIPVTFLFYELQRRYRVSEQIHRLTPVVLVAQEVPKPHEIDEDWLITYDWILRRVILDDTFLPALTYLSTQVVGDEFALDEMRKNVEQQRKILEDLKEEVVAYRRTTGQRYAALENAIERQAQAAEEDEGGGGLFGAITDILPAGDLIDRGVEFLTGPDIGPEAAEIRERAARDAYEMAAQEERDLMARLNREITAVNASSEAYTKALSGHLNRRTQIERLRVHVKQNILYYMQAIWSHEPDDQRFFRLHKVQVPILKGEKKYTVNTNKSSMALFGQIPFHQLPQQGVETYPYDVITEIDPDFETVDLVQVADLDKPLGYKGNYMIFPLIKSNSLTDFMMQPYKDNAYGEFMALHDPDELGNINLDDFSKYVCCLKKEKPELFEDEEFKQQLKEQFERLLTSPLRDQEEIIVPTGSLFIEALPGTHPILEDFKLMHRAIDVKKVQAEVREAELENIRLAARLLAGEREDPDVEKKIVIEGGGGNVIVPVGDE